MLLAIARRKDHGEQPPLTAATHPVAYIKEGRRWLGATFYHNDTALLFGDEQPSAPVAGIRDVRWLSDHSDPRTKSKSRHLWLCGKNSCRKEQEEHNQHKQTGPVHGSLLKMDLKKAYQRSR
jgi:hypothetical protein